MNKENYLLVEKQQPNKTQENVTKTQTRTKPYRENIYIIKDIIMLLSQYGQLNQTALLSYSGLNLQKHRHILTELESRELITRTPIKDGKRTITMYKVTGKGMIFCKTIIAPYEELFPRKIEGI